jgi:hypothetical protein
MIVVRDVFKLHFGKAREALALMGQMREVESRGGYGVARAYTDLSGEYYTLVMESEFESLAAFETAVNGFTDEWRAVYARFVPLVREGRREIYRAVPLT